MTRGFAVLRTSRVRVVMAAAVTALAVVAVVLSILVGPLPDLVGVALIAPGVIFVIMWGQWIRQVNGVSTSSPSRLDLRRRATDGDSSR